MSKYRKAYAVTPAYSNGSVIPKVSDPFGPEMAAHIFDAYDYGDDDCAVEASDYYGEREEKLDPEDLFNGELHSYHFRYQEELDIETPQELAENLRHIKRKFRVAHQRMAHHALKWFYLSQDIENNPQIKKMFDDLQLMRKLSGSQNV
jgi:hypothetical protein